ncbi:hypothetical protein Dacet_1975 [Denitrovibrio acetiphilus DSM 12809]|uniref:Lipoprotein n=1 Tax=Denitrovibrio acetiphilus (strain DSM 12809 / NBRC 114555 / N2460) TaxID=522772 RepID=D4H1H8_DENA2|nr:hypothetical protein [Denitrovibrio acetiphilus]ADD68738.1 hypothetical protein Dacet_1975 [Denitrovibrio acetiphilus DSM 12809]
MKKIIILLTICSLVTVNCAYSGKDMQYSIIHTNKEFNKALSSATVINSWGQYQAFLMKRAVKLKDPLAGVDFDKNSVLLIYTGAECPGCGMELISVKERFGYIEATGKITPPDAGDPPMYFLKIKKTDKQAKFVRAD